MNGMSRFLSRREKNHEKRPSKHHRSKSNPLPSDYYAVFSREVTKSLDKEDDKKIKALLQRLDAAGIKTLGDAQAYYALSLHPDDLEKAYEALLLANDAFEGVIADFDPDVKMLGAVNRNMVTCYLDALLFAMFARLDSFEAMLYDNFTDEPRKKLAAILRLWVNFLRTGRLISVDFTKHLQDALAQCGWEEAANVRQQDASEAFTFITGTLELPLLTLKMDIYHTGREDKEDDHKFVNERLLEVALPEPQEGKTITLEDCLESYFNNRIEVKRYLQRQNTTDSGRHVDGEKNVTVHIETLEVSESNSPIVSTPTSMFPSTTHPNTPSRTDSHPTTPPVANRPTENRPVEGRRRADSIFSERYRKPPTASDRDAFDEKRHLDEMWNSSVGGRPRATSLRKEVLMPAWQFFSLIPWYTDNVPQTDAQVAAHFSSKRPVLGICLKRYQMLADGTPKRLNTFIDIPLEIGLPHFVSDDRPDEVGPLFGNFKLVLQSVVCHRGTRVDAGHYVSLVRANKRPHNQRPTSSSAALTAQTATEEQGEDEWFLFDDLARDRVRKVDIKETLSNESPYLLFFQVQPIDEELASRGDPPPYSQSQSASASASASGGVTVAPSKETLTSMSTSNDSQSEAGGGWESIPHIQPASYPASNDDLSAAVDAALGRSSMSSNRRSSVTFDIEGSIESLSRGRTAPPTPVEDLKTEEKGGFLSASRRGSRSLLGMTSGGWMGSYHNKDKEKDEKGASKDSGSGGKDKSRPTSQSGPLSAGNENGSRLSLTLSRLTGRGSKDRLSAAAPSVVEGLVPTKSAPDALDSTAPPTSLGGGAAGQQTGFSGGERPNKSLKLEQLDAAHGVPGSRVDKGASGARSADDGKGALPSKGTGEGEAGDAGRGVRSAEEGAPDEPLAYGNGNGGVSVSGTGKGEEGKPDKEANESSKNGGLNGVLESMGKASGEWLSISRSKSRRISADKVERTEKSGKERDKEKEKEGKEVKDRKMKDRKERSRLRSKSKDPAAERGAEMGNQDSTEDGGLHHHHNLHHHSLGVGGGGGGRGKRPDRECLVM